jgi:hypothetical protein
MAALNASVSTKAPALVVAGGLVDGTAVEEDGAAGDAAETSRPPHPPPAATTTASIATIERGLELWILMVYLVRMSSKEPAIGSLRERTARISLSTVG